MLFVRYVLSYLRWNDLFSNRIPLNSIIRSLTCTYYIIARMRSACGFQSSYVILDIYTKVIPLFNSKTRFVLK